MKKSNSSRYDEALANLKTETAEYQEQKEQYETKLISLRKDENEKESQYNVAKSELDILLSTEQKEQCKLESLETKYQTSTAGLGGKKAKMDEHSKAIPDLQSRIKGFENEIQKNSQIHDELSKTVRSARANFEETRVNQSQTKSRGKVLDSLMKQKKTGALSGMFFFLFLPHIPIFGLRINVKAFKYFSCRPAIFVHLDGSKFKFII